MFLVTSMCVYLCTTWQCSVGKSPINRRLMSHKVWHTKTNSVTLVNYEPNNSRELVISPNPEYNPLSEYVIQEPTHNALFFDLSC